MHRRYLLLFGVLTVLWTLLLLVGPRYPQPIFKPMSYRNIDLPGPFALSLSVDSPEFMRLALDPARLLAPHHLRQSRPGMVFAAAPLALALAPIVGEPMVASFIAYLLLHIATLVGSFALYLGILRPRGEGVSLLVFLTGLLLLFNDLTVYFLLSPHTSLLNILASLFCLWIADRAWRDDLFHDRRVFWIGLLAGIGFVSYGSFLLAFPALLLPAVARDRTAGRPLGIGFLVRAAAVGAAVYAPALAWYAFVVARNGAFYSAEVEVFRGFVWIADGLRAHDWQWVAAKALVLARIGVRNAWLMSLPALAIVAVAFILHPQRRTLWLEVRSDAVLAVFVSVLFLFFFVLSGYMWDRNVYSCAVPFVAVAGSCVAHTARALSATRIRAANWAFALVAVAYGAFVLLKDVTRTVYLG